VLRAGGFRTDEPSPSLVLARGEVVVLPSEILAVGLRLRQFYRIAADRDAPARRRWHVLVTGYQYTFVRRDIDQELLAFHWHPHVAEKPFPHVHLEAGLDIRRDLVGIHVPTGPISLTDVVRFAIEELQVRPRRSDWQAILDEVGRRLAP
jgi:hypothetical protein